MKRRMRTGICCLLAGILLVSLLLSGCGKNNEPVMTINKEQVNLSEAIFYTRLNQQQWEEAYAEALGTDFWTQSLGAGQGTFEDELKRQVIETLCEIHLMNAHAKEYDVKLGKEEKREVDRRVRSFLQNHSKEVKDAAGASEALVADLLTQRVVADQVAAAIAAGYEPQVTEEEASLGRMTYCLFSTLGTYDTSGNHYGVTAEEAEQIAEDAQAFFERALELGDLIAAADEISHASVDVYFNDTIGGGAHEDVLEVLRGMTEGQIAGPVKTEEGYYVFQYVSAYDKEATMENRERLAQAKRDAYCKEIYEGWRSEAKVVIHEENWDAVRVNQVMFVK